MENLVSKKMLLAMGFLVAIAFLAGAVVGQIAKQYSYPQQAIIEGTITLETYLDGALLPNNTLIDWNYVVPGLTYYYDNLTVKNTGNINCTVYLIVDGLPSGWTETWTGNSTLLEPSAQVSGELTLTVASDATPGTYTWDSYIRGEQA